MNLRINTPKETSIRRLGENGINQHNSIKTIKSIIGAGGVRKLTLNSKLPEQYIGPGHY